MVASRIVLITILMKLKKEENNELKEMVKSVEGLMKEMALKINNIETELVEVKIELKWKENTVERIGDKNDHRKAEKGYEENNLESNEKEKSTIDIMLNCDI